METRLVAAEAPMAQQSDHEHPPAEESDGAPAATHGPCNKSRRIGNERSMDCAAPPPPPPAPDTAAAAEILGHAPESIGNVATIPTKVLAELTGLKKKCAEVSEGFATIATSVHRNTCSCKSRTTTSRSWSAALQTPRSASRSQRRPPRALQQRPARQLQQPSKQPAKLNPQSTASWSACARPSRPETRR